MQKYIKLETFFDNSCVECVNKFRSLSFSLSFSIEIIEYAQSSQCYFKILLLHTCTKSRKYFNYSGKTIRMYTKTKLWASISNQIYVQRFYRMENGWKHIVDKMKWKWHDRARYIYIERETKYKKEPHQIAINVRKNPV